MSSSQQDVYSLARRRMVADQLRARKIHDERVLQVMGEIPRERFVAPTLSHAAYDDRALQIDCGQTISQPYMVAIMTQSLMLKDHHCVLEIGTGSGYQAAILAKLARHVFTVERVEELALKAKNTVESLGIDNVSVVVADGTQGLSAVQPDAPDNPFVFDRILVTAGAPEVPQPLVQQLVDGGRLVIPVGGHDHQDLLAVDRKRGRTVETSILPCRFVKLIGQAGW